MTTYLTTAEVAERLKLKPATISDYCKRRVLPGAFRARKGSPWRIPEDALDALAPDPELLLPPRNARSASQQGRRRAA
ncbi:helix-turn-helix domain-containing protein [Brachybacterium sp.]|uniref:helix-turn-helix domain-containing protein n=1 Tax=Brachybacterium sp. TaxID=1891286 RepID=UPI002ED40A12